MQRADRFRAAGADHYYWLTALLAARGAQTLTCRLVAVILFGAGLIPLIMSLGITGQHASRDRLVASAVTLCCVAMAALWLRHSWPSRGQSQLCVVVGTVCIAAACSIAPDPLLGLLGSTTFALVAAFVAFFHSGPLLVFTWAIGAATLGLVTIRLAETSLVMAVSGPILVVLVNIFTAFPSWMAIRLIDTETRHGDIEPLTGLLSREAFYDAVATLIGARNRNDDRYLVVAVVNLDNYSLVISTAGAAGGQQARIAVAQQLREAVRREVPLAHVGDSEFLIADLFNGSDPSPLIERVRRTVTQPPARLSASIGAVSTPLRPLVHRSSFDVVDEVLALASSAMYEARRAGGNQARLVLNPALTVLDEPDNGYHSAVNDPD